MNRITMLRLGLATAAATTAFLFAAPASAQATRTWVSGVGDDVNPCSRTAPCKTFAGAISKTAAGGEINCLDPGGFGAVTITKAMTISCPYTEGGALAGGNGITVNAGVSDVVFLRGLDIFGVNPPTNGVRFIAGGALHIEDSTIRRFNAVNSFGVSFQPSGTARLFISNTTIANNGNGATGGGILIQPTGAAGGARVHLSNVRLQGNANIGLKIDTTNNPSAADVFVTVENSQVAQSTTGISLFTPAAGGADATLAVNNTVIVDNTTGIRSEGNFSRGTVANSTITQNTTGVSIVGGIVNSYGNNRLNANGTNGTFTPPNTPPL